MRMIQRWKSYSRQTCWVPRDWKLSFRVPRLIPEHFNSRLGVRNLLSKANMAAMRIRPIKISISDMAFLPFSFAHCVSRLFNNYSTNARWMWDDTGRELKHRRSWAADCNRKSNVSCFWRGFAPYHGQEKLLLITVAWRYNRDDVKTLQKGKNSISGCRPWLINVCA